jgi:hypothetical protein
MGLSLFTNCALSPLSISLLFLFGFLVHHFTARHSNSRAESGHFVARRLALTP